MSLFYSFECKDWLNVILAIIGIFVSGCGLAVAIHQICKVKKASEQVQDEVIKSQERIRQTLDSNDICRAVKNLEQAIDYVSKCEYRQALTRMLDVKVMIENDVIIRRFLSKERYDKYELCKRCFNESLKIVSTDVMFPESINRGMIQNSLTDIHGFFAEVENQIKNAVYVKND